MNIATRNRLVELLLEAFDEDSPDQALRTRIDTIVGQFPVEQQEVTGKLKRYVEALKEWRGGRQESPRENALRKAVLLFNHHLFFEVHEVLETQWRAEDGNPKLFLQGLIQVAVAFYHLENRNFRGALALLHDGLEKLLPFRPAFWGIEVQEFTRRITDCFNELYRLGPEHVEQFRTTQIPPLQGVEDSREP